jgi:hypothetical protein
MAGKGNNRLPCRNDRECPELTVRAGRSGNADFHEVIKKRTVHSPFDKITT